MEYTYLVGMRLATPNPNISLNENPFRSAIITSINTYNSRSEKAPNPKSIKILNDNFFSDSFVITLKSQKELITVGKALKLFSQLISNSGVFDELIKNGKVFTTFPVSQQDNGSTFINPNDISDCELLKSLIDYVCNKSDNTSAVYKRKRNAITQIKQIAIDSGIISITKTEEQL